MKSAGEFKVIECGGTPYEIGRQWGEGCKENILKALGTSFDSMAGFYQAPKEDVLSLAMKFLPLVKDFDPYLVEIMRGQADGIGISFEEIFTQKCSSELTFYYNNMKNLCTSFAATGRATQGGETLIGQNIDYLPETPIDLIKVRHSDGLEQYIISIYNATEWALSTAGFGNCVNATIGQDYSFNIPLACYLPRVMRQKNIHAAMELLKKAARGLGYYHLADANGEMLGIESVHDDFEIMHPERDMLFHSNHYITERFKKADTAPTLTPDSYHRLDRIRDLANRHYGKINIETVMEILADHDNYPDSICRHFDDTKQICSVTLASFIMVPDEGKMYLTRGNPCEHDYVEYKL